MLNLINLNYKILSKNKIKILMFVQDAISNFFLK